jgi:PAS domain S-box-containing protein
MGERTRDIVLVEAEEALHESETRYRALVDECFHGMLIQQHGIMVFANAALAMTFGYENPAELIGQAYWILAAPTERERLEDYCTARRRSAAVPSTYEFQGIRKDGSTMWLASIVAKVPWHGDVAMMLTVLNIDERKRMEDELHTLSHAIDQSPNMMAITDTEGIIEYVNTTFTQRTGYTRDEMVGRALPLPPFFADASVTPLKHWQTLGHSTGWQGEWLATRKNGERYREFMSITPIRNAAGVIAHFLVIKDDVGEDMRMQQRLNQAERLASLGTLAAGLGHELNQPLTVIRVTVDSMLYGMQRGWTISEERLAESLRLIAEQCQRAATILDDIRTFARDDPKRHTRRGMVHAGLERVLRMIGTQIKVHGIALHEQLPPTLPPVTLSQAHLEQVLLNLITNARQALDTLDRPAKRITITAQQDGAVVVLYVEDNGPGMAPEVQARLFDPFFTTKEPGEGTGLGLSIVHGLVTDAGGEVAVSTRAAGGAVFMVRLPVAEA